ncbi:hypothetical protein COY87_05475 [Candidatus Roizmanbacteria bacterium CG_4_10_14_0_8_um_filter_33_9]|uniref:Glycosyltransferase 2-like domain-containing protein n=1 Tax=Candidatus Roizmanbacteria bacterium CG_4_10_14_0_8_um_filter_33_9 TaxID=1974826 RepID=A0A2M7QGW8_9BACT|nr:MAG: hypothetical protein COY87_05475 [Candidatus Roizmanbacteria bacterium CG_4_10_14_0_8_um_filter_33_9]
MHSTNPHYCIIPEYKPNLKPTYFHDEETNTVWQPDVYELAYTLAKRSGAKYIIDIGSGNGEKLIKLSKDFHIICIDHGANLEILKKNIPKAQYIDINLENEKPVLDDAILLISVVICSDVIEHLIKPDILLYYLSKISYKSHYLLLSTPDRNKLYPTSVGPPINSSHVREWTLEELEALIKEEGFNQYMIGHTVSNNFNNNKNTILLLSGRHISTNIKKDLTITAIVTVYNEEDIVDYTIRSLLDQDIRVHAIDNWSTDNSLKILKKIKQDYKDKMEISQYPAHKASKTYDWYELLRYVELIASKSNSDWILHHDADEIRESPWTNTSLKKGIEIVDILGYNAINFTVLNFYPVKDGFSSHNNPERYFAYFNFGSHTSDAQQIKAWKNPQSQNIGLAENGGHNIHLNNKRVFPLNFLLKHYSWRSAKQIEKKLLIDRLGRINTKERKRGWHSHYNLVSYLYIKESFPFNKNVLTPFNSTIEFYREYIVERLSGSGQTINPFIQPYINKIASLENQLQTIYSARFFKLWQFLNSFKKLLYNKDNS